MVRALAGMGIAKPTLVQSEVVPLALKGKDVLVKSATGSGKTLCYLIPLLQKLLAPSAGKRKEDGCRALVLVPTRELCDQVERTLKSLLRHCAHITTASLGSGTTTARRARLAEQPDIVVATPGRAAEHADDPGDIFAHLETLVVDEADMCLSFGCRADIERIANIAPRSCQCMLMSATLDDDVKALKSVVLNDAVTVKVHDGNEAGVDGDSNSSNAGAPNTPAKLAQWCVVVPNANDKDLVMYALLKLSLLAPGKAIFFVNSVDRGYRLKLLMDQFGAQAAVLNAELPANSRRHILDAFDRGAFDYLIATDDGVAAASSDAAATPPTGDDAAGADFGVARGVDFRDVQTVVNVEMPPTPEAYIHRVGRTARAGAAGTALSLVDGSSNEAALLESVRAAQPPAPDGQPLPAALALDLNELQNYRYRVEDTARSITKRAVKEARMRDLRQEIINSERLQAHFEEHPDDLRLLRHDAPLRPTAVKKHMAVVPSYLAPGTVNTRAEALASMGGGGGGGGDDADEDGDKRKRNGDNKKRKRTGGVFGNVGINRHVNSNAEAKRRRRFGGKQRGGGGKAKRSGGGKRADPLG